MKRLTYAGTEVITGSAIAIAVLKFCEALAEADASEVVSIPSIGSDGSRITATLVVGPASQMIAIDVESDADELADPEVLSYLAERTRAQRPTGNIAHHDTVAQRCEEDY